VLLLPLGIMEAGERSSRTSTACLFSSTGHLRHSTIRSSVLIISWLLTKISLGSFAVSVSPGSSHEPFDEF